MYRLILAFGILKVILGVVIWSTANDSGSSFLALQLLFFGTFTSLAGLQLVRSRSA